MNHRDYVAERDERDPRFRAAREALRPEYEYRRALIAARLAAGLTQKALATRLGTTQSAVARLESGTRMPRLDTLHQLAAALRVDFTITPSEALTLHPQKRRRGEPARSRTWSDSRPCGVYRLGAVQTAVTRMARPRPSEPHPLAGREAWELAHRHERRPAAGRRDASYQIAGLGGAVGAP